MVKVLVIGDEERAPYHPLSKLQAFLESLDLPDYVFRFSSDYSLMETLVDDSYDIFLSYVDCWKTENAVSAAAAAAVLAFTARGGTAFILHTGIALQERKELAQMAGAFFTGHPPYTELNFRTPENTRFGLTDFAFADEPYMFDRSNIAETELLLEFELEGQWYPAAWHRGFGKGQVVYLMPGHDERTFEHPDFQTLFLKFWETFCPVPKESL